MSLSNRESCQHICVYVFVFFSHSRKCTLRRLTPTRPTFSSTSSRESSTPSSCRGLMAKRWPTPVAWMKTLSLTTKNTVSFSESPSSSICWHSLLPPAALSGINLQRSPKPLKTWARLWCLSCVAALSTLDHKRGLVQSFCQDDNEAVVKALIRCTLLSLKKQTLPPPLHQRSPWHTGLYVCIQRHLWMYASVAKPWNDVASLLCIYHSWFEDKKEKDYTSSCHVVWAWIRGHRRSFQCKHKSR